MGRDDMQGGDQPGWCQRTMIKNKFYFFTCFHQAFKIINEGKCILAHGNKTLEPLRFTLQQRVHLIFPFLQPHVEYKIPKGPLIFKGFFLPRIFNRHLKCVHYQLNCISISGRPRLTTYFLRKCDQKVHALLQRNNQGIYNGQLY